MNILNEIEHGQHDWAFTIGVQAAIWGLPLVECWKDRLCKLESAGGCLNAFRHVREIATAGASEFVNAGSDFLYTTAVVDLRAGPVVVTGPDMGERWYGLQILDPHMETLCNLGKRTMGGMIRPTVLVGSSCPDALRGQDTLSVVRSESDFIYIVGRIAVGAADTLSSVHALQDGFAITPWSSWCGATGDSTPPSLMAGDDTYAPLCAVASDCPPELRFFEELGAVLKRVSPRAGEAMLAGLFREIGLSAERGFDHRGISAGVARGLTDALAFAGGILERKKFEIGERVDGWTLADRVGNYGYDYIARALVAKHGIWGNVPEESLYLIAMTDDQLAPLHGHQDYEIRFTPDLLPPVEAFWSLSYYDIHGNMVDSPDGPTTLSSQGAPLRREGDGTLVVRIGAQPPRSSNAANWLQSHDGPFCLNLRCYQPKQEMLERRFRLPAVSRCTGMAA